MIQTPTAPKQSSAVASQWDKFSHFKNQLPSGQPDWVDAFRRGGMERFAELGFPTIRDEDWRFTNVTPITKLPLQPSFSTPDAAEVSKMLAELPLANLQGIKLVFVDGRYSADHSTATADPEVHWIKPISQQLSENPGILQNYLGRTQGSSHDAFAALNTAFFLDGVFIRIPAGKKVATPVHLIHLAIQPNTTAHPRHLVVVEKNASLTLVEHYAGTQKQSYFTNTTIELQIGEGATVEHCKFQNESLVAFHIANIYAELASNCNFVAHSFSLGSRLARNNIRTGLIGPGVECVLNGLYLTKDDQLADHHMIVEHAQPNCNSHEYFNGILDGKSRGVFHGRIFVRPIAQKTDAKQTNKNLLLSDDAAIDTKPQLEIYADDVKCTHGATVGQLNEESIFYLRARGIGADTARRMLMHAFAGEIIDRVRDEELRNALDQIIWNRLEEHKSIAAPKGS